MIGGVIYMVIASLGTCVIGERLDPQAPLSFIIFVNLVAMAIGFFLGSVAEWAVRSCL